ncbi:MAG: alpha-N-acetylglucosaminidase [Cellulosilyticaceae bacterium]
MVSILRELISRRLGNYNDQIVLEQIEPDEGRDVFEIGSEKEQIVLRGNNNISLAKALYEYLKYEVNAQFSWCGEHLDLPERLPVPQQKRRVVIEQKHRVYLNYCTLNYSASWWDWERWEKEIDFMALNGINMPLSVVGLEGVWYEALLKMGLTDEEARGFLVGPAFLAWQWMTNIQSHGGPLPKSWIEKRVELGKKILARQLEWGMHPIQQGFTGYVPTLFKEKFPEARIQIEAPWCNFEGTAQLDPLDPLFKCFGQLFLETQKDIFGAHHFYAADPFHEGTPPEDTPEYLTKVGAAIRDLMFEFDNEATWVMQAWSIRQEIATTVPKERLIVLDLNGETAQRKAYFWGYPFVTGNLHNFGGRINLHGDIALLAHNQYSKTKQVADNVCGTGLFMEAIGQNPAYYDLAFEQLTSSDQVDLMCWFDGYILRRYGMITEEARQAWRILRETVYRPGTNGVEKSSMICARPAIAVKKSGPNDGFEIPYENKRLLSALNLLLEVYDVYKGSDGYLYDLVDLARQVLTNYTQSLQTEIRIGFEQKDWERFHAMKQRFLKTLEDTDALLGLRSEFSFEQWVKDARRWGDTVEECDFYEWNASMLVTIWGPVKEPTIFDYAWKEWSGLISQYYKVRWEKFYSYVETTIAKGEQYTEEGLPLVHARESFRANAFYEELAEWELEWIATPRQFEEVLKMKNYEELQILMASYQSLIE